MSTTDTPATAPDTENPTIWKPQPLHVIGTADDEGFHDGKAADFFDGGDGTDTVVFGGRWEEYRVEYDAGRDAWTVARHDKTPDNADVLVNVERLSFFDVEAPIESFAPDAPQAMRPARTWGTEGEDHLAGSRWNDRLQAGDGDDLLAGGEGNDVLIGGKGDDTAVYRGNLADYELRYDPYEYGLRIIDKTAGRDGDDRVHDIGHLRFADTTVDLFGFGGVRLSDGTVLLEPWQPPPPPPPDRAFEADTLPAWILSTAWTTVTGFDPHADAAASAITGQAAPDASPASAGTAMTAMAVEPVALTGQPAAATNAGTWLFDV
jgi:Ca2+-binding RTX toxin-like protein